MGLQDSWRRIVVKMCMYVTVTDRLKKYVYCSNACIADVQLHCRCMFFCSSGLLLHEILFSLIWSSSSLEVVTHLTTNGRRKRHSTLSRGFG